jgi:hypothetical protein
MLVLLAVVSAEYLRTDANATSSCVCTTVPCPVAGNNYLTEGKLLLNIRNKRNYIEIID